MEDLKLESGPPQVIPVTEYDPFEAKFCASLYWLVFRATEDGEYEDIPSQVTSPVQRDNEHRVAVRPEVVEFLCNGDIYCKVCCSIFPGKAILMGHRSVIQTLSRNGIYVVEDGDIAVTETALQQKKPFRKSTHLALMDALMTGYVIQVVSIPKVVQSVRRFTSFNASKELPFDSEDSLLLWLNKTCAALNAEELKKQKLHAEQLLQNQDKAKRFRFRRDQLQPRVQTTFPQLDDLLKDISDGQCLLGMLRFYYRDEIQLEDIRLGKDLPTEHAVYNLELFRSKCSELVCTSALALKVEDLLYGSQAMQPNLIVLLAEIFHKCEEEAASFAERRASSASALTPQDSTASKENGGAQRSSSAPVLNSASRAGSHSPAVARVFAVTSQDGSAANEIQDGRHSTPRKAHSDTSVNRASRSSFTSPFQLSFTADIDLDASDDNAVQNGDAEPAKEKQNPFSGILQRAVLAGEGRKLSAPNLRGDTSGSPRLPPKHDQPLLTKRAKQKPKHLAAEDWDAIDEGVEDNSMLQRFIKELRLGDRPRSQSLTGLDAARIDPRRSLQAWPENPSTSASDTNLSSSRSQRISVEFRPNQANRPSHKQDANASVPIKPSGLRAASKHQEEHMSQDSLSSSPRSVDSLNTRTAGPAALKRNSLSAGAGASYASDSSIQALRDFEDVEAMLLAGRSLEGAEARLAWRNPPSNASTHDQGNPPSGKNDPIRRAQGNPPSSESIGRFPGNPPAHEPSAHGEEDLLNTSVSSDDMNRFRLEVLQRLSEDRLRDTPQEEQLDLEDDDPISRARQFTSPREPQTEEPCQENMADPGAEVLSPRREMSEPYSSTATDPNSGSSTAPSTPCSPLDVAPFTPTFFTTSPANSLDRRQVGSLDDWADRQNLSKNADGETEATDAFPSKPAFSETPRRQIRGREPSAAPNQSTSFEHLARGSYTVDHVPIEAAKAAGIPVIGQPRNSLEAEHVRGHHNEDETNIAEATRVRSSLHSSRDSAGFQNQASSSPVLSVPEVRGPAPTISSSLHERLRNSPRGNATDDHTSGRLDPEGGHVTDDAELAKGATGGKLVQYGDAPQFRFSLDDVKNLERTRGNGYGTYTKRPGSSVEDEQRNLDFDASTFKKASGFIRQHHSAHENEAVESRNAQAFDRYATYRKDLQPDRHESSRVADKAYQGRVESCAIPDDTGRELTETCRTINGAERVMSETDRTLSESGRTTTESARRIDEEGRQVGDFEDGIRRYGTYTKPSRSEEMRRGNFHDKPNSLDDTRFEGQRISGPDAYDMVRRFSEQQNGESQGTSAEEPTAQPFTFDHNSASPRELDRWNSESNRPKPSPSSLSRSRTFRKKPNGDIIVEDIPIESRDVSAAPSVAPSPRRSNLPNEVGSTPTPRSGYSGPPENESPRRVSPVGIKSDVVRTSWSEEVRVGYPEGAEMKNAEKNVRRRHIPKHGGRASPGARISWLTAGASGVSGLVMLNDKGEIEEGDNDAQDESQAVTSQMTLLRMQLEEKRRHIEAEKRRSQEQWEEHRRQVGHTAFWYMMGKARGTGEELGQGTGNKGQALFAHDPSSSLDTKQPHQQTSPISDESRPNSNRAAHTHTAEEQRSPPIARSSPVGSPVAWQHAAPAPEQEYETREFRLSNFPPNGSVSGGASTPRQTARKCWGVAPTTPTSVTPFYPPESDAQSNACTPAGKGWVGAHPSGEAQTTPPWKGVAENQAPFTPPQSSEVPEDARGSGFSTPFSDEVQGSPVSKGVVWSPAPSTPRRQLSAPSGMTTPTGGESLSTPQPPNEAEMTPQRKGVALFFGDESSFGSEIMTPEQQKKKERFLRQRQKKQEEEKARKEEELEKRRRKEAKQQEEAIRKMQEEKERAQAEERKAMRSRPTPTREVRPSPTPEGFSTYRGPALPRGLSEEDVSSSPGQKSGFADFSGPQCYVKPSGKSNRKLITNAITYVCLSGAVNKDQKDKCLQAIAESGGYHFMVLFKDALKFRGLYSYNPDSDQAFKIFGIGPRIINGKMVEDLYKYNSGAKEFTKIFSKTLSISIDGLTIQKACWQSNRPVVQSKTMSNLKRGTPRAGQR